MILITGARGQLGMAFQRLFQREKIECIATDKEELNITDEIVLRDFVKGKKISLLINCAAYNQVDKAEAERGECRKLNSEAPGKLAILAGKIGADYITYSTDFVFDGEKNSPYTEEDIPNPLSVYGRMKWEGEKAVFREKQDSFIIRTSWIFGKDGNNFIQKILEWAGTKQELFMIDDQISSLSYAEDLAYFSWKLFQTKQYGLYHFSNSGESSKYDQAKYILEKIHWKGRLHRAKREDFPQEAKRPKYSKLDSSKLEKAIGEKIPSWEDAICRFLEESL
ncbi:MAG TPA: dTDP-4-dehydrorhamnose reductase [Fusobacterium sp.]|uniref:dTDP-4-dehydrorhamnose reductase n=1 Tax=Fusobacterium sp. TaxID=68766 RepID=UPI002F40F4DE